jgi:UDP-N-acetyl-D-mannosaminuronic acid dehydrogenase
VLQRVLADGLLTASTDAAVVATADHVLVVIGTPVDEHLNPDPSSIPRALEACSGYFDSRQILILRSTVYPGVTVLVEQMVPSSGSTWTSRSARSASPSPRR